MNVLFTSLFILALARVSTCGIGFDDDEYYKDYYGNDECYDKCDNTRECRALDRYPRNKAKRCLDFLEDKCFDSDNPKQCLDNLARRKQPRCPSGILRNAVPCLKCETDCEDEEYYYGGGYSGPDIGDRELSRKEKQCLNKCNATKECVTLYKANKDHMDKCKTFSSDACEDQLKLVDCLELTQSKVDSKCPQTFRKDAFTCMKCEDNCITDDEDVFEDVEEKEKICLAECSKTPSCMIMDGASEPRMQSCMALTKSRCEIDEDDKLVRCLESISDVSSIGCPKVFRKSAIMCLKCDNKCTATASEGADRHIHKLIGGGKCEAECDAMPECKALDEATFDTEFLCNIFILAKCAMSGNVTQCISGLSIADADKTCPVDYRKNMIACINCDDKCQKNQEGEKKEDTEECFDECSETSSCISVDHADKTTDAIDCLEKSTKYDITCPAAFRKKLSECMKCDRECENPTTMPKYGTCAHDRMQAMKGDMMIGKFIPQCDGDGNYKTQQCSASSGYCWCVDKMGKEREGTRTPPGRTATNCDTPTTSLPKYGTCAHDRMQAMKGDMMIGKFIPQCDGDGNYKTQQCSASSGYCWCVDKMGKEREGTRTPPGRPAANCDASTPPMPKKGTCTYARMLAKQGGMVPGKFIPQCDDDGNYKTQQCSASSGYCWCVDKMMGRELEGTKTPPGQPPANCAFPNIEVAPPPQKPQLPVTPPACTESCSQHCAKKRNVIKPDCMACIRTDCDGSKVNGCVKKSIEVGCRSRCFLDEEAARRKACTECTDNCSSLSEP
ncbi:uncharacterized protein LOC120329980 isoform X2 [Styela clava]